MIGHLTKDQFDPDKNYDEFYAGHKFEPFPESLALCADEVLPRVAWAVDVAKEIEAKNVLDLCCLDGFASLTLASKLGIRAIGVDLSKPGIELANKRAQSYNLNALFFAEAIEDFAPTDTGMDMVLLFEAIEHFIDVDRVMSIIKAQLKPGGTLLVSTPDAEGRYGIQNTEDICHLRIYSHREDVDDLKAAKPIISLPSYLREQGFEVLETEVFNELIHCRAILV